MLKLQKEEKAEASKMKKVKRKIVFESSTEDESCSEGSDGSTSDSDGEDQNFFSTVPKDFTVSTFVVVKFNVDKGKLVYYVGQITAITSTEVTYCQFFAKKISLICISRGER